MKKSLKKGASSRSKGLEKSEITTADPWRVWKRGVVEEERGEMRDKLLWQDGGANFAPVWMRGGV